MSADFRGRSDFAKPHADNLRQFNQYFLKARAETIVHSELVGTYIAFILDSEGNYRGREAFEADDDSMAVKHALKIDDGHSVELWGEKGLLGTFKQPNWDRPRSAAKPAQ